MKGRTIKDKKRKRPKALDDEDHSGNVGMDVEPKSKKKKSAVSEHKATLESLQKTDPKFYEFLKEQDAELLDFDVSDAEDEEDENENEEVDQSIMKEDEEADEGEGPLSDDEQEEAGSEEDEGAASTKISITPKLISAWHRNLLKITDSSKEKDLKNINKLLEDIVNAFRAVVAQTGARPDKRGQYRVDDSAGFNGVVRLCFSVFPAVWQKMAGADPSTVSQGRQKRLRPFVKPYLHNLAEFLQEIQNVDVLNAVLKHLTHVADYYSLFGTLSRRIIKVLVTIWSTKDESARVLAFVSIMKLVRGSLQQLLPIAMKKMYLAYVQNTKLVTPATWPLISFMQKSYAELCGLDAQASYQHAFVYIRQMAIHLRNAVTTKKKEQIMAVYNWQFVQCLYLWARVLSTHSKNEVLRPLVYPLMQATLGCAKLIPTAKYFPLRFHCVRAILMLAQETRVYVPAIPIILEVFQQIDIKKKHLRQSLKPLDFDCLLKLSQSQLQESAFKIGVVEAALELIVETMNAFANSVAFPELAFACCSRLKAFYKSCHIPALSRPVKELSDKISEHASWIEKHRLAAGVNLARDGSVEKLELEIANSGDSPLRKYFEIFKAMKERERKLKLETAADKQEEDAAIEDDEVEEKRKQQKPKEKKEKAKRPSKRKEEPEKDAMSEDVVQDLNLSDLDD